MEDDERRELLQMSDSQLMDIARVCNRFPNIDLTYDVVDGNNGRTGVGPIDAPSIPKPKEDGGLWLVIPKVTKSKLAIKRVSLQRKAKVKLDLLPLEKQERRPIPSISCVILIWVVTKNIALLLISEKQALLKTTVEEND
ncbi:unnamed protein product [Camellia sinensis]